MNFLFVHQFFPGQHIHLVRHLQEAGHNVILSPSAAAARFRVRILEYLPLSPSGAIPPHLRRWKWGDERPAVARPCEA
jgi:hypothetical protein